MSETSGETGHPLLRSDGTAKMVVGPVDEEALARAEAEGYRRGVEAVKRAILDIDAHATALGEDERGFVTGGYRITVGSLHRALGVVGHTAPKCDACCAKGCCPCADHDVYFGRTDA